MRIQKKENFNINADTELYCIFGNPVRHSLSPAIHNAAFIKEKINAVYLAFEVKDIKSAVNSMRHLNIRGASVTIPFKNNILKYIDNVDVTASEIGAVNTLMNKNGRIYGYNNDGTGAVKALLNGKVKLKKQKILIIGNGGSARAVSFSLLNQGAEITIAGRDVKKIMNLTRNLNRKKHVYHTLISRLNSDYMRDFDIIINTTPVGMSPGIDKYPINPDLIMEKHAVFDIIYSPHKTSLLKAAEKKGCKIIHGIEMLLNQGAAQFEIWTGKKAPMETMRDAIHLAVKH